MATFGYTTIGGTTGGLIGGIRARFCYYDLPVDGDVTSMTIYAKHRTGNSTSKLGIYNDVGGAPPYPNALQGETNTSTITNTAGWFTHTFAAPLSLTAGKYHLAYQHQTPTIDEYYDAGAAAQEDTCVNVWPAFPDPFGASLNPQARKVSIYATYTASGAAPGAASTGHVHTRGMGFG